MSGSTSQNFMFADASASFFAALNVQSGVMTMLLSGSLSPLPSQIAVGSVGGEPSVFFAVKQHGAIRTFNIGNGTLSTLLATSSPSGIAVDSNENVYFMEAISWPGVSIKVRYASSGAVAVLASNILGSVRFIAVTPNG
jgi:hypothetical protein